MSEIKRKFVRRASAPPEFLCQDGNNIFSRGNDGCSNNAGNNNMLVNRPELKDNAPEPTFCIDKLKLTYSLIKLGRKFTENDIVDRFVVFPNPVTNKRFVYFYTDSLAENKTANISFHDLKGSFVHTQNLGVAIPNELVEIDVSFLRPGSYILTYINGSIKKKSKLVVI